MSGAIGNGFASDGRGASHLSHARPDSSIAEDFEAYALQILQAKSPEGSRFDSNLANYITSILRASLEGVAPNTRLEQAVAEFESLVGLLQDHSRMTRDDARIALEAIGRVVVTGEIPAGERSIGTLPIDSTRGEIFGADLATPWHHSDATSGVVSAFGDTLQGTDLRASSSEFVPRLHFGQLDAWGISNITEPDGTIESTSAPDNLGRPTGRFVHRSSLMRGSTEGSMGSFTSQSMKALIPEDLLGVLDDPSTPTVSAQSRKGLKLENTAALRSNLLGLGDSDSAPVSTPAPPLAPTAPPAPSAVVGSEDVVGETREGALPSTALVSPMHATAASTHKTTTTLTGKGGKKKSKAEAKDLAAALFRPARSRSNESGNEQPPSKMRPGPLQQGGMAPAPAPPPGFHGVPSLPGSLGSDGMTSSTGSVTMPFEACAQILVSMNAATNGLGEEAAIEAAMISNGDVNVAQHVLDGALSSPPVCRHLLNGGCFRSDCQFSHNIEGHTCLFWLRGRCGKGEECRFMHGFSEKLLEGIDTPYLSDQQEQTVQNQHHTQVSAASSSPVYGTGPPENSAPQFGTAIFQPSQQEFQSFPSSAEVSFGAKSSFPVSAPDNPFTAPFTNAPGLVSSSVAAKHGKTQQTTNSFAAIASKSGRGGLQGDNSRTGVAARQSKTSVGYARIPIDLWNDSFKRDASAFNISDPMQRFHEVSKSQSRQDVIDLHFQSVKTFPVVLDQVLERRLELCNEVWIITGTGHHVNQRSHQKGGGVLESAVLNWLSEQGYNFQRGRDKTGHGGAILVTR